MVNIITDSTADLGSALLSRYNIDTIPLYVIIQGKSYVDGIEIDIADLFKSVQESGQLPKTSAATIVGFQELFERPGEQVYIGISSQLSATVRNAQLAAEQIEPGKVHLIDSLNLSSGIGLLALKAAQLTRCRRSSPRNRREGNRIGTQGQNSFRDRDPRLPV